ncbi:lipase family protein [Gordonia sp. CPCC 205515]|uniref:lipase family protein n=1 Tax=Gordonia sp. CPCC 205515 TaxID=3140791 RepID=UPI003AF36672
MRKAVLCVLMVALSFGLTTTAVAHAELPRPAADAFYRYDGPLAGVAPGTVLRSRPVTTPLPGTATQVLYRTTDQLRRPAVTAALVVRPNGAGKSGTRIVAYQQPYDALDSRCNPSYATTINGVPTVDQAALAAALTAGYTVVTTDYEGADMHFGAGHESGYGTLDGIRAAQRVIKTNPRSTPVAMIGLSGGSIATEFAAELAATYAPELNIVGAVVAGLPVNILRMLDYIDGSPSWSKVIPLVLAGTLESYDYDVNRYLSPYGTAIVKRARGMCGADLQQLPVLTMRRMLKPQYQNYQHLSPFVDISKRLTMGTAGTPRFPIMMIAGNSDGIGDGVMVAADQRSLAHSLCDRGVAVDYRELPGVEHTVSGVYALAQAVPFLQARFAGRPPVNNCSSIAPSAPLASLARVTAR